MRIAVWNTAFLGDTILTLPLIQSLHCAYPTAKIDFYVRKGFASLFRAHPALDTVFEFDKRGKEKSFFSLYSFVSSIRKRQYALWLSPHTSLRSSIIASTSGSPRRISYCEASYARLAYTDRVERRFGELHETERLLPLLSPLSLTAASHWPEIHVSTTYTQQSREFFASFPQLRVGIHPGSAWKTKCWPLEYFAEIALRCLAEGHQVLLFGSKAEEEKTNTLEAYIRNNSTCLQGEIALQNLSAKLDLPSLAAYIKELDLYVSNDSGPMHLAWTQHVPTIALFGPTVKDFGFFPLGTRALVMEQKLPCRPCGLHGHSRCPLGHHACMRSLTPDMVWPYIAQSLDKSRANKSAATLTF